MCFRNDYENGPRRDRSIRSGLKRKINRPSLLTGPVATRRRLARSPSYPVILHPSLFFPSASFPSRLPNTTFLRYRRQPRTRNSSSWQTSGKFARTFERSKVSREIVLLDGVATSYFYASCLSRCSSDF